jgi:hypothetical protein
MAIRQSRVAPRMSSRMSSKKWNAKFDDVLSHASEASKLLAKWGFYGVSDGFVRSALWAYTFPRLDLPRALHTALALKPLSTRLRSCANEMQRALDLLGAPFFTMLDRLDQFIPLELTNRSGYKLSVVGRNQPQLLRLWATLFDANSWVLEASSAPRKLLASRALAWLFLCIQMWFDQTPYQTYGELSLLVDVANEASGKTVKTHNQAGELKTSSREEIRARITRFKEAHADEFLSMRNYLRDIGVPPTGSDFILLLMVGSAFPRPPKK